MSDKSLQDDFVSNLRSPEPGSNQLGAAASRQLSLRRENGRARTPRSASRGDWFDAPSGQIGDEQYEEADSSDWLTKSPRHRGVDDEYKYVSLKLNKPQLYGEYRAASSGRVWAKKLSSLF